MKIKAFKKLCEALSVVLTESEELLSIDELLKKRNRLISIVLLNIDIDLVEKFIEPFTEELDINLLLSSEGKNDKIKFYLYKLRELNLFLKNPEYEKLLFQSPIVDNSLSTDYNLIIITHYLYDLAVGEIQYCCLKYNIDFLSICKEVDFDYSTIDCGISLYADDKENKKSVSSKINPFSHIFEGDDNRAYNVFEDWANGITDSYVDFSFIFQIMISEKENLIKKRYPHLAFMNFLKDNNFITQKEYEDFIKKESFSKKADSPIRLTRYYDIKEKYFPFR